MASERSASERPVAATTVTGSRGRETPARRVACSLHVVFPPELRRTFPLGEQESILGRDPGLDGVLLDHGTISRRHAALAWSAAHQAHAVRDLDSRNGTSADAVPVTGDDARALVDGSLLRVGDMLLVYEQDAGDGTVPGVGVGEGASREAIPGEAARIRRLRALVARAAADPAPVLILGETGTGKERIAREIHRLSGRTGKHIAVNCAALSAEIVESQLFGHTKGAFTGAGEAQPGLFRAAHGGTVFLDEIGDLPLALQPKLLRVLQEGEVLPVGATQPARVDVRVVAATHRDLARAVGAQTFREDLYARLSIWELAVPPLRERRVDLLGWVDRLHAVWAAKRDGAAPLRFEVDAAEALLRSSWPLNLRGVERLVHELGAAPPAGGAIRRSALPAWLTGAVTPIAPAAPVAITEAGSGSQPVATAAPTREEFMRAYEELNGSVHGLARRFARDRRQIYRWLEAYGLREDRKK